MESSLIIGVIIVVAIVAGVWYFARPQAQPPITTQNTSNPSTVSNISVQNSTVPLASSYNDSDALNDLGVIINPMSSVLSGTAFLNDSNDSNVLNQVTAGLASFESNSNLSVLSDRSFFIYYAGAVAELATANQDYLNFLLIQDNQTVGAELCSNKQVYLRSLFFLNKSAVEVLNASEILNLTSAYPALSSQAHIANTTGILQGFSKGLQENELSLESSIYARCG
jgi:hypothetical protein